METNSSLCKDSLVFISLIKGVGGLKDISRLSRMGFKTIAIYIGTTVMAITVGIPFSDPMADGKVIQESSFLALKNGMSLPLLLEQLEDVRTYCDIPLILMGYLNPILQFA